MSKPSLNYYQAVHVGKVKTDVIQFTSIQAAIAAITDNLTTKRYAVYVHPGTYTEKITMKPYVDLIAIGGQAETVIAFTATAHDEPTVTGENSLIKGFVISSTGGAFRARCVQAATAGFALENCALQVVSTAAAAIALNATASCTITDCAVDIAGTAATAALFTTGGMTYTVNNSVFGGAATTDAIQVTTTPTLNLTGCTLSNNFNQDGGTVVVVRCQMEALAFGTAICTFTAELSRFTAGVATADNFAHVITCAKCSFNGQNFNNAATGATTITLRDCDGIATLTNAGVAGTVTLYECGVETLTATQGTVTAYGGRIAACGGSTGTRFVWWKDANFLEVLPTMKIADALAVAASGDVTHISKGTFAENSLTAINGVDIVGDGSDISIIEDTSANPIITVGNNVACGFRGVRMSNLGAGAAVAIAANALAATLSAQDCEFRSTASIVTLTTAGAGAPSLTVASCIFRTGTTAIAVTGAVVGNTIVRNCTFATCTLVFSTTGANHTFAFDACDFGAGGVTLTANAPVVTLSNCEDIGTFTHSTISTVTLNHCRLSGAYTTGAVAAIVTAYATTFAAFTHAGTGAITLDNCGLGAVSNNSTATMTIRESHMDTLAQGAAAGTINVYNSSMGDITGNGGTIRLEGGCRFSDIAANAGVLTWKVDPNHFKVVAGTANMKIFDALALAGVGDVITVYPGTYAENNLNLKASVDLVGTDPDQCLVVVASANPILNAGVTCSISNLTVGNGGAGTAITVTANILTVRNCYLYGTADNAIAMTAGTLIAYDTRIGVGDIDLSTAPCTLTMYRCQITADPIDTAATAFAHAMTFEQCDFGGQNIASLATVGTTLALRGCTNVNAITNAGTGAFTIRDSDVVSINNTATGTFTIYGGYVNSITRGAASVVWWKHSNELCVLPSATTTDPMIASALAVASSGDVIKLTQGTFAESLTAKSGVNIMGEGWGLSIIETTNNGAPIIAVGDNITCEIHGVKVSNLGTGGAIHIEPVANNSAVTIEDCLVSNAGVSDCVVVSIGGAGSGTLNARRCDFDSDAANSIVVLAQTAGIGLLYFNSWDCQFGLCGGAANGAIEASAAVVADVNVTRAVFTATCAQAFYCAGANHTVDIEDSEFNSAAVGLANPSVVNLTKCNNIGVFSHAAACTVTLRDCYLSNTYTIIAVVGVVNAYRTQFSTFTNGGSGAIAFQECNGTDINNNATSTMTIEGGHWDTVLQAAAAGTINIKEAVIATELDCSAAGAINAYNCQITDIDSNGGTITLYGGQLTGISDSTGTIVWWIEPHTLRVISSTQNMKIMAAADAAAAGDTILIGPGTFTEALNLDAAINVCTYKGFGRDKTIITQATNTVGVVAIGTAAVPVVLEDLTINATAGTDGTYALLLNSTAGVAAVTLRNVKVAMVGTGAVTVHGLRVVDGGANVGTVVAYNSYIEATTGGTANYAVSTLTTIASTITLYDCILNGTQYDVYNNYLTCTMHSCELNGGGAYIANNAAAICVTDHPEAPGTVTPVTFAGAAGEFADLTGAELYTCLATVLISEAVYVSAANTVAEATNAVGAPLPAEGIVVYKPAGAAGTQCYVKNSGMAYMATPPAVWAAGTNVWLGVAGGQLVARPTNALKQVLGVGVDTKRMLINIASVEVVTDFLNIPIAWGAGTAPTGTHTDGNSRRAVAIAGAAQTIFSQAVAIPEGFLAFSKLYVTVFPAGNGSFDWTAYSSAASSGQDEATHMDTATADAQPVTDDIILDHDISAAADGYTMVEKDIFSAELLVDVLTTITQLEVLGFRLEYTAQRGA